MNKEKPIIFSTEMVRAIMGGRKTMTRRAVSERQMTHFPFQLPYHSDDILWVRETWRRIGGEKYIEYQHKAYTFFWTENSGWKPSIFMPRAAARLFLRVTDIRAERLQNITEEDAKKEGVDNRVEFIELWDKMNKKRGHGWDTNPYVWVIEFEKLEVI